MWKPVVLACLLALGAAEASRSLSTTPFVNFKGQLEGIATGVAAKKVPDPPVWPAAYSVKYHFDCPYVDDYQGKSGRTEVEVWRDVNHGDPRRPGAQKITRQGTETTWEFMDSDTRYFQSPFFEGNGCFAYTIVGDGGPTRRLSQFWGGNLSPVLPDLTEDRWKFNTTVVEDGQELNVWRWFVEEKEGGPREMTYLMYVDAEDGAPVKLDTWGLNYYSGGHWDHYISYYYDYVPEVDSAVFDIPEMCALSDPKTPAQMHFDFDIEDWQKHRHRLVGPLVPNAYYGDDEYDVFAHGHQRKHASADEYEERKGAYYAAKAEIDAHNAKDDKPYEMGINRFADWTENEHASKGNLKKAEAVNMTPPEAAGEDADYWREAKEFVRVLEDSELPGTVDWRGTGADGPVKDQNYCGSCWAFSAIVPIESAYYRTFGESVLLSEQELVDCDWKYGSHSCFGGNVWDGFQQAIKEGVTTAYAIPYVSAEQRCKADAGDPDAPPRILKAKEFYTVKGGIDAPGGIENMKEAVLRKGPLAINLDYKDSLKWYRSGIYHEPTCTTSTDAAGHAAGLVGYGVEDGVEFWIVKNVWGPYWGEDGYIRITMHGNDCAVGGGAKFVEIDEDATVEMREIYRAWEKEQRAKEAKDEL